MKYINGFAANIIKNNATPKVVHRNKPCLHTDLPLAKLFSPSASATNGVIAVENPIPKDMAINIKLLPKDTAANSAVPNCPTIILSISPTKVCPSIPSITGVASCKLYRNSLVYCCSILQFLKTQRY